MCRARALEEAIYGAVTISRQKKIYNRHDKFLLIDLPHGDLLCSSIAHKTNEEDRMIRECFSEILKEYGFTDRQIELL